MVEGFDKECKKLQARVKEFKWLGWISCLVIPALYLSLLLLWYLGFNVQIVSLSIIFGIGFALVLLQQYLVWKKWLIDPSYRYLYSVFFWILIAAGIRQTGGILSPFIWVGLFSIINESIYYNFRRGMLLAGAYILFFWVTVPLDYLGIISHAAWIPGFHPYHSARFVFSTLIGYTLFYIVIPFAVGHLSDRLRKEKLIALQFAEDVKEERNKARVSEREIAKLYEELKVVDRMKTEFFAVMSHELRTPLTPIKGYSAMFLNETFGKLPPQYIKAAGVIQRQGDHLLGLIDSILDVSRMERGKTMELNREPVSLKGILDDVMEVMEAQFSGRQIKTSLDFPEKGFPTLIGDPAKIRRLITNLLGNTLKFTPAGGSIKIVGRQVDDSVQLQVIDDGIGINAENLKKVFDKFYQVDGTYTRAVGGVGLGLTICKEIVEAHGGKIWAESEGLGKGARFIFTLPLV
ncbi:MAG: HAMP domain-containing sensor histidine kinase [Candidatus Margulisiibacteriota bacterium]